MNVRLARLLVCRRLLVYMMMLPAVQALAGAGGDKPA